MKTVCIGHAAYDITLSMDHYPIENTKNRVSSKVECGGGPASNAAYLLGKWGMDTHFIGVIGKDRNGSKIKEEFRKVGVHTDYLVSLDKKQTTTSYIMANSKTGSRTILTNKEEALVYPYQEIEDAFDVILVDGEELEMSLQILKKNPNAISVMDVGKMREATMKLGPMVTYFICSKEFAESYTNLPITGDNEILIAIYEILRNNFQTNIVITLEDKGCFTRIGNTYTLIPSLSVDAVDSTGAGDIFHGAFTYFISNHYSLYDALLLANVTGAISVTRVGGRYSIPTLSEVLEVAKENGLLSS